MFDFSSNSLRYARETAVNEGLDMIMCDFCALGPDQRATLLRRFRSMLTDGGAVLLDVYSPPMLASRDEAATYSRNLLDGFWSAEEYYGFLNTFKYEDELLLLDKYTIVERARVRRVFNWLQCFTPAMIEGEFMSSGLQVARYWNDVAGSKYDPSSTEFAVEAVATVTDSERT